ncbi:MAG: hypothetical protein ACJ75S_02635 [Solirubrobacterales bacterium]
MPFEAHTRELVDRYARGDLAGDLPDHVGFFSFLADDQGLMQRVGEEYFSARYIYKLLEGLQLADEWALRAQVQLQVQQYASIYEACIHHLLFTTCAARPEVQRLLRVNTLKRWSVPESLQAQLVDAASDAPGPAVGAFETFVAIAPEKVRFEHKADVAADLGIIDAGLGAELKEFYAARNMIHIHAELKKGADWDWEIELAKRAYLRLEKFRDQVVSWQGVRRPPAS